MSHIVGRGEEIAAEERAGHKQFVGDEPMPDIIAEALHILELQAMPTEPRTINAAVQKRKRADPSNDDEFARAAGILRKKLFTLE